MLEVLGLAAVACGVATGVFTGLAAVIREVSAHKVAMRLLDRGDTPPPRRRFDFTALLRKPRDKE